MTEKDLHKGLSYALLDGFRKEQQIVYNEFFHEVLAEKLTERVLRPWMWSEVDVERKINALWEQNKDFYKKNKVTEKKARKELLVQIQSEFEGRGLGVFVCQKSARSIASDFVDFLYESEEIEDVFPANQEVQDRFVEIVKVFK